jgi:thymidine kinase
MLTVIIGPMFSGKTSELIRRIKRYQLAGKKTTIYKPSIDVRYSIENVNSHDGLKYPARIIPNDEKGVSILADEYKFYDVIGIDEIQFFPPSIAYLIDEISYEKDVIAAGLNLDYRGKPWETVEKLLPYADQIISLSAVCYICGEEATRTIRTSEIEDRILVGGEENYKPVCKKHFKELSKKLYQI